MARGVNKVILVGNLGKDPEVRYTASGSAMANITLATTSSWQDKTTGEKHEQTEWHRVVFYAKLAEIVGQYLRKGRQVYVEGRLQTRKWQDQAGQDRYTTEIIALDMQMLGNRGDDAGYNPEAEEAPAYAAPASSHAQPQAAAPSSAARPAAAKPPAQDFDDDIPF